MHSHFPYLDEHSRFEFPPVESSSPEGIVAVGGRLSPGMLISAYSQGIFPWYTEGEPILWWSPEPRCVLFPEEIHVSRSMHALLKKGRFRFSLDTCFDKVINACKNAPRPGQRGTWITDEMLDAYISLHRLGYAHSVEVWDGALLAGGMYGVSLGRCFFGESMFTLISNASKAALIHLTRLIEKLGFIFLDCQVYSPHLGTMGARRILRREFMSLLRTGLQENTVRGMWTDL
jgi:leucyl/phenylalanyl-tRNA--protein transferase